MTICMYMDVYVCMYLYWHMYSICIPVYVYVYVYMCVCICVYVRVYVCSVSVDPRHCYGEEQELQPEAPLDDIVPTVADKENEQLTSNTHTIASKKNNKHKRTTRGRKWLQLPSSAFNAPKIGTDEVYVCVCVCMKHLSEFMLSYTHILIHSHTRKHSHTHTLIT